MACSPVQHVEHRRQQLWLESSGFADLSNAATAAKSGTLACATYASSEPIDSAFTTTKAGTLPTAAGASSNCADVAATMSTGDSHRAWRKIDDPVLPRIALVARASLSFSLALVAVSRTSMEMASAEAAVAVDRSQPSDTPSACRSKDSAEGQQTDASSNANWQRSGARSGCSWCTPRLAHPDKQCVPAVRRPQDRSQN